MQEFFIYSEHLILVDTADNPIGTMEKLEAHREGKLHRAFSIFIFNSAGQVLLQQRHPNKYHSGGLWSNSCCGHPRPGEDTAQAARRRLKEEMGFDCLLQEKFSFIYKTDFGNGLTEYEFDHVFTGIYDGPVNHNDQEAISIEWAAPDQLTQALANRADQYTYWLKIAWPKLTA